MRRLGDVLTFAELQSLVPHMPPELVKLLRDLPPAVLDAFDQLLDRVGALDEAQLDALAVRIATVRAMQSQMTDKSYREAILRAVAAKPH